ncbi:MaoC/PaaZ C-terminal domain-containing protein [Alphaproteobacteria bacterium]|nr:MaoC/PaaZ C-terminal domain-containing protein [Alphaproteobacteria bacterium]
MTEASLWRQYSEGLHIEWPFSISKEDMRLFSDLSGDGNPLHLDSQFAQTKGFSSPVVYGVLLCAQMSRLIGEEMPDKNSMIMEVQMEFLSPCFPKDALIFSADLTSKSDSTRTYQCKCKIIKDKQVMCKGTVGAIWKP